MMAVVTQVPEERAVTNFAAVLHHAFGEPVVFEHRPAPKANARKNAGKTLQESSNCPQQGHSIFFVILPDCVDGSSEA